MRYLTVLCGVVFLFSPLLFSQSVNGDAEMQTEILSLYNDEEAGNAAERLAALTENPVVVNSGNEDEIVRLFFLTSFQVKVLADYVKDHGNIATIYEIALLPGFDRPTAMLMEPYITLAVPVMPSLSGKGRTSALLSAIISIPSSDDDSIGLRSVLRISHSGKSFCYGLTAENDPWESYTFHKACGADFVSAHLVYNGKGTISRVVIGDYSLRFGEGLVFNNSSWQGSWLISPSFMAGREVIDTYTSTDENNFFRGVGAVIGTVTAGAAVFLSSNTIDARLSYNSDSTEKYTTNLVRGGLHNTGSGREARNSLTENIIGMHLSGGGKKVRGGITLAATFFSTPFKPDTTGGDDIYKFHGSHLVNAGADIKAGSGNLSFFGELAFSFPGSFAALSGIRALPTERVTFNLIARYLDPGYHVFHSNVYGTGSTVANEIGLAGNIHIEAAKHLFVSAGADIYRIPWLSYQTSAPATGTRSDIKIEYTPSDILTLRGSFSKTEREYDDETETVMAGTEKKSRLQSSLLASWSPPVAGRLQGTVLSLTSRVVWCRVPETSRNGYLLCQDVSYSLKKVKFWLRYSLFTTQGWDTRLYAYENDLLHSFSIPPLHDDGSRAYIMLQWDISPHILLRTKYAVTVIHNGEVHQVTSDLRAQLKITL
ncbi:MAG TPA: hypothetical protein PKH02_04900 [Bacteroidales bacterium]|nr:hypothetical protein [Bacteroidales bacterium]HPT12118.1 hypothetical protein [Bacteroidales bacterium]